MTGERVQARVLGVVLVVALLGAQLALMRRAPSTSFAVLLLAVAAAVAVALVRTVRASAARQEEAREARLAEALRAARRLRQPGGAAARPEDDRVR